MFQADPVWDIFHKSLLYFKTTSHSKHLEKTIFFVNWQNSKGLMKNSDKVIDRNERMYIYISYSHCKGIKVLLPSPERETYKYIPLLKLIKQFNVLWVWIGFECSLCTLLRQRRYLIITGLYIWWCLHLIYITTT